MHLTADAYIHEDASPEYHRWSFRRSPRPVSEANIPSTVSFSLPLPQADSPAPSYPSDKKAVF